VGEQSVKLQNWLTADGARSDIKSSMMHGLLPSLMATYAAIRAKWDDTGKHTWEEANQRP
jgi:hypothetical protein